MSVCQGRYDTQYEAAAGDSFEHACVSRVETLILVRPHVCGQTCVEVRQKLATIDWPCGTVTRVLVTLSLPSECVSHGLVRGGSGSMGASRHS